MSATMAIEHPVPLTPSVPTKGGRRPRPKTVKRKLQNRAAQRKYREKQARMIENLKRQAAAAQTKGPNFDIHPTHQSSSAINQTAATAYPSPIIDRSQLRNSDDNIGSFNPNLSAEFSESENLEIETSKSFIPEITSIFNETFHLVHEDSTISEPFFGQSTADMRQANQTDISDVINEVPLDSRDANKDDNLVSRPSNQVQSRAWATDVDSSGKPPTVIDLDSESTYQIPAAYLNEYGTIDKRKYQTNSATQPNQSTSLEVDRKRQIKYLLTAWFHTQHGHPPTLSSLPLPSPLPSPFSSHLNTLRLTRTAILDAYLSNAVALGLDNPALYQYGALSPFYQPQPQPQPGAGLGPLHRASVAHLRRATASATAHIPADLRPTPPQVLCPHHPFLDLLPFPVLRARAIALSASVAPAAARIDVSELKSDLLSGGLVCWGGSGRGGSGSGGRPWEMRSWEAEGWFLRKWAVLVGGEEEEVWKGTRWWRGVRGEG